MMKPLSETKSIEKLRELRTAYREMVAANYEHKAKSCATCETQGACCLDAHFVNVHISRLEAAAIRQTLGRFSEGKQHNIHRRIETAISKYALTGDGDTYAQTYSCPLFEKGIGCLVHEQGKPIACITHACYENKADLPPVESQAEQERLVDALNTRTYGRPQPWLPLPLAIRSNRYLVFSKQRPLPAPQETSRLSDQ